MLAHTVFLADGDFPLLEGGPFVFNHPAVGAAVGAEHIGSAPLIAVGHQRLHVQTYAVCAQKTSDNAKGGLKICGVFQTVVQHGHQAVQHCQRIQLLIVLTTFLVLFLCVRYDLTDGIGAEGLGDVVGGAVAAGLNDAHFLAVCGNGDDGHIVGAVERCHVFQEIHTVVLGHVHFHNDCGQGFVMLMEQLEGITAVFCLQDNMIFFKNALEHRSAQRTAVCNQKLIAFHGYSPTFKPYLINDTILCKVRQHLHKFVRESPSVAVVMMEKLWYSDTMKLLVHQ